MQRSTTETWWPARASCTGAAWLSSARVVRCWVKSRNERNPRVLLSSLDRLPCDNGEEGEDDVKSGWPLWPGLHTYYNARHKGKQYREVEQIPKTGPSSDRRLQLACVKVESLVIADQHAAVNTFPGLVHTARHITKACCSRSAFGPKEWPVIGMKS